jgi:hypothetical protein
MFLMCGSAYSLTQEEYVQSLGIEYSRGDSFDMISLDEEPVGIDLSLENVSYVSNTSHLTFLIRNTDLNRVAYDYLLRIFTNTSIIEEKIDIIESNNFIFKDLFLGNSSFIGISVFPLFGDLENNISNNVYLYDFNLTTGAVNDSIFYENSFMWDFSVDNISYQTPLTLNFDWKTGSVFNISENFLDLNFTNSNNLMGEYIFMLRADDFAEFFINNVSYLKTDRKNKLFFTDPIDLNGGQIFGLNYIEKKGNAKLLFSYSHSCPNNVSVSNHWRYISCDTNTNILLENYLLNSTESLTFDLGKSLVGSEFPKRNLSFSKEEYFEEGDYEILFKSQRDAKLYIDDIFINTSQFLKPKYQKINGTKKLTYLNIHLREGFHSLRIELPQRGGRKFVTFDLKKINTSKGAFYTNPYSFSLTVPQTLAQNMANYPETNWENIAQSAFSDYLSSK